MKKNNLLLLMCFLFFGFSSCYQDEQNGSHQIDNAEDIMRTFNAGKLVINHGELLEGEVYMRFASENRMAIYIKEASSELTKYFILQTQEQINPLFEKNIPTAQLFYFRQSVLINSLVDGKKYQFRLADANEIISNLKFEKIFSGYGLARIVSDSFSGLADERGAGFGGPGDPPDDDEVSCGCNFAGGTPEECDSGGFGSGECAISDDSGSCSVSCTTGFYSCCNNG